MAATKSPFGVAIRVLIRTNCLVLPAKYRITKILTWRDLIFIKGLVSNTHILQGILSSWNNEKQCSPGATKIFARARIEIASFRILDRTF